MQIFNQSCDWQADSQFGSQFGLQAGLRVLLRLVYGEPAALTGRSGQV